MVYSTIFRWHTYSAIFAPKITRIGHTVVEIIVGSWVVSFFETQCDCTTTQQRHGISYCNLYVRPVTADAVIALYYGNLFEVIGAFLQFPVHIDIVQ